MTFKFELGLDFLTMHLSTKFRCPMFNHSEVIVLTNKQRDSAENIRFTSLSYAGGKNCYAYTQRSVYTMDVIAFFYQL